jgi:transposase
MKTAYKFRIYPNRQQEAQLELTLDTCRHLYNLALADRKYSYETEGISRTYEDQAAMLVVEKKDGNFTCVFSQVLQDVLRRLDKSFKAFFRRVKSGEEPGYPRFKAKVGISRSPLSPSRFQVGRLKADSLQDRICKDFQTPSSRRQGEDLYHQER